MKEEAKIVKLPPKMAGGGQTSTPTKMPNDEIISSLLRINNFDSISSLKDESLDIDLSACVTINPNVMINGNSLSSTDFWRALDESAQNPQLDLTINSSDESLLQRDDDTPTPATMHNSSMRAERIGVGGGVVVGSAEKQQNCFSGTFLRPEPPAVALTFSPIKKIIKALPAEQLPQQQHNQLRQQQQQQQRRQQKQQKVKLSATQTEDNKKMKISLAIKEEPPELLFAESSEDAQDVIDPETTASLALNGTNTTSLKASTPPSASRLSYYILPSAPTNTNNDPVAILLPRLNAASSIKATAATKKLSKPIATQQAEEQHSNEDTTAAVGGITQSLFKCLDCNGLVLHGHQEQNAHAASSHRVHHMCHVCERDFQQDAALKKHLKTHRTIDTRKDAWKKCPECGKCLKIGSMWMHRKIHSENKKYGCDICGQKFVQKINLTHHSRVHTAEKPFECPECQKRFQERSHLQRHQKYHAQTRSYRCDKCGKMYKTERCLKVHNLVHLEQRPFACTVCEKSFISNSKLKQHSNIHTGERPFKCNYCPRDFTNFPNWLKHTRRRHKVDHKTGEHLENIPSYCSKKSAKTAKTPKANEATTISINTTQDIALTTGTIATSHVAKTKVTTTATATLLPVPSLVKTSSLIQTANIAQQQQLPQLVMPAPKTQVKRSKKKVLPADVSATAAAAHKIQQLRGQHITNNKGQNIIVLQAANTSGSSNSAAVSKIAKMVKRERKQSMPKQIQKPTAPPPLIKREPQAEQQPKQSNFPDLHCLSMTSAEELIMEQALEMEECGLYDTPSTAVDTDNAISSETAAALHFKIKNEYGIISADDEDYLSMGNRMLCSSLESSPYSSPASNELAASGLTLNTATLGGTELLAHANNTAVKTTTYYLPSNFSLHSPGGTLVTTSGASSTTPPPLVPQQQPQQKQQQRISTTATVVKTEPGQQLTQALINHLYLPMTVNMPLLGAQQQPQQQTVQALPSVDTLLFSTHANASTFLFSNAGSIRSSKATTAATATITRHNRT